MTRTSTRAGQQAARSGIRVPIRSDSDIVLARERGREIAKAAGFQSTDTTLIATVISELARNIVRYAKEGEIVIELVRDASVAGVKVMAHDEGPGIWNVEEAMQVGYSTSGGLGLGLPGVKRLMDEMIIVSKLGKGTTVKATKWNR